MEIVEWETLVETENSCCTSDGNVKCIIINSWNIMSVGKVIFRI